MTNNSRIAHRFGGVWTEIKLRALTEYLHFYQNALKNRPFETWYIDAFAGTGDRHAELERGGIFEGAPIERVEEILDGSARKALQIEPPFDHYWFNEAHRGRGKVLHALKSKFPRDIIVRPGEANVELRELLASGPWAADHPDHWKQRGVCFLDPYGMSVEWSTLEMLAKTQKVDVWYLFPRKAVIQQLPHDQSKLDVGKRRALNKIFGTDEWEAEFYQTLGIQHGLFEPSGTATSDRAATPAQICVYAEKRLKSLFCYVSPPLPLIARGRHIFELYCLSNNGPAVSLIKKGVEHVIGKYTPASHRTSSH